MELTDQLRAAVRRAGLVTAAGAMLIIGVAPVAAHATQQIGDRVVPLQRRIVAFDGQTTRSEGPDAVVSLDADIFFDFDSADLNDQSREALDALAQEIVDRQPTGTVTVTGHTDSTGTDAYNLDLSQRRADAVAAALTDTTDLDVVTAGEGERQPVAPNDTDTGRRRNRRVEIRYTPTTHS